MVSLLAVTEPLRPVLVNLFQLYAYDWSELRPLEVGDDGRFADHPLDRYLEREPLHHAFLLRAGGHLAGFALIAEQSRLTGESGVCDMAEFFVMRGHRRRGVGRAAAMASFDLFRGRRWEVRQRDDNPTATAFWRNVIDRYTGGRYRESRSDDAAWVGPVQCFSTATG
jgi:predicted acetyltransferase